MSSDQNEPGPEWWQQPQDPKKKQGYQGNQDSQRTQGLPANPDYQDSQATRQFPPGQGYSPGQGAQDYPGGQGYQGPQGTQGTPGNQGFPEAQGYQGAAQGYQGPPGYQGAQGQGRPRRARRRRRRWPLVTLIVIIVVLVVGDRAANAYTENQMASQIQSSLALSGKPTVTIQGFPFLTQLAARDFKTVDVNASNETITASSAGSGLLKIASLTATLHGMHIHGLNSATIDQFTASALITFSALGNVGGIPQGITLSADGPNQIKADISLGPLDETAVAQVTQTGSNQINVKVVDAGGIPVDALGSLANFSFSIPKLPAGVTIQSISVTQQGLRITAAGQNTTLSQ
jgi:LmeA-like phospholipid-binding